MFVFSTIIAATLPVSFCTVIIALEAKKSCNEGIRA